MLKPDLRVLEDGAPVMTAAEIREEIRAAKVEILKLQTQKETLLTTKRLWYWKPTPRQFPFFHRSSVKRRAGFCGNRFGKSTLGVVEDCCWLIGYRPFFAEGDPLRYEGIPKHGVKGLVIAEDWDKVKEIFTGDDAKDRLGKFLQFLPDSMIKKMHRNQNGIIDQITIESIVDGATRESLVVFETVTSFKQRPLSFESGDWDFIHIDEPVPKALWLAVSRGLIDREGSSWWLLTPLTEPWMYNEMVVAMREQPHLYWWFEASMHDNPTLTEEAKEMFLAQLPEDERDARQKGIPLAHGRLVYGDYMEDYHHFKGQLPEWSRVVKPNFEHSCIYYAIDTHPQTPHAVLFANVAPDGAIDIFDEIFKKCRITELSDIVAAKLAGLRVVSGVCEPGAWNEDQGTGTTYADIFAAKGLDLVPGSKDKETATLLTQDLFKQRLRVVRVHTRCVNLRRELITNHFNKENKPEDKDDHLLECLRRIVYQNPQWYPLTYTDKPLAFINADELKLGARYEDLSFGKQLSLTNI